MSETLTRLAGEGPAVPMTESQSQRVAVVTGASSGIGLYTAIGLARAGMRVVMAGRDRGRTEAARRLVAERSGSDRVEVALADFSRLGDVRRLADEILAAHDRLDVLVNNAGLFSPQYRLSADGFELTFCNILFTRELASRLDPGEVAAACLHPGMVATGIGQRGGLVELGWRVAKPFMLSPEKGAETPVFLATVPDPKPFHGGYVIRKTLAQPDPAALDNNLARRLWDESSRLVGL